MSRGSVSSAILRHWRTLLLLTVKPRTAGELASLLKAHKSAVERDLKTMQAVGLPVESWTDPDHAQRRIWHAKWDDIHAWLMSEAA